MNSMSLSTSCRSLLLRVDFPYLHGTQKVAMDGMELLQSLRPPKSKGEGTEVDWLCCLPQALQLTCDAPRPGNAAHG